jgi:hypothetical protein
MALDARRAASQSTPTITSEALMMAVAGCPTASPQLEHRFIRDRRGEHEASSSLDLHWGA